MEVEAQGETSTAASSAGDHDDKSTGKSVKGKASWASVHSEEMECCSDVAMGCGV